MKKLKLTMKLLCALAFLPPAGFVFAAAPATKLTVGEGFVNPLGFHDATPAFSWKLPPGVIRQTAFRIQASTTAGEGWDSGWVESDRSVWVPYGGAPLASRERVTWKVNYRDDKGAESGWSETAHFELGLLSAADWKAKWIRPSQKTDATTEPVAMLRRTFHVAKPIAQARLYATARGVYEFQLNGARVGNEHFANGFTSYKNRIDTFTHDVTKQLRTGDNTLEGLLGTGWYAGRFPFETKHVGPYGTDTGLLAQLEITYADGSTETLVSDEKWEGTFEGPIVSSSLYDGENYDARRQPQPANWAPVAVEEKLGDAALTPKPFAPVREMQTLAVQQITQPQPGRFVFDLGQNMVGWARIKIPVGKDKTVRVRFAEMLQSDGTLYTENYRTAKSTDAYTAAHDGVIEWEPHFTFHGFRYVELSGLPDDAKPEKDWVTGVVLRSDLPTTGKFQSSHAKLNQLQSNIIWGWRGNSLDIPTDCPQRDERMGWTGDAQVFCATSMFNTDAHAFWKSWLVSMRDDQYSDGAVPAVVPLAMLKWKTLSPGWMDAATFIPWDVYVRTGDMALLAENFSMMERLVAWYRSQTVDGLLPNIKGYGDWLQPYPMPTTPPRTPGAERKGDTPPQLLGLAFYARSAQILADTARALGRSDDAQRYGKEAASVRADFTREYFDADGKLKNAPETQTAYVLAIAFDLVPRELKIKAGENLVRLVREADGHLRTGFLGTPFLATALDETGHADVAAELLFKETYPSWFYPINQGATTMWERWNSYTHADGFGDAKMNSFNHYAYGAIGQWMYERVAGLAPDAAAPGYKHFFVRPLIIDQLDSASAELETPYGKAASSWKKSADGRTVVMNVTVPPNTTATIQFPDGRKSQTVQAGAHRFESAIPVSTADKNGGYLFVTFRDEKGPMGEQVYFALSKDGVRWDALNDGKPALLSALGEKGARDPYLLRAEDGKKFFLIATDLSINLNPNWKRAVREGSRSLLVWESDDLVRWSELRLVNVAPPDAGCTWAPEAIYDSASKRYLVYWASTTKGDDFEKHRIWAAWTTDFRIFSEPFIYIEKPTTIIDTDIVRGDDGKYYRFTKDEKFKAITMEVSDGGVTGTWSDVPGFSLAQLRGYEGPACYQLAPASDGKPAKWCLLLDAYATRGGYKPFVTDNLAGGNFTPGADFEFPFRFRHGSVLPISREEFARIQAAYAKPSEPMPAPIAIYPAREDGFTQSLNGVWSFKYIAGLDARADADFYKTSFDVSSWKTIRVPSNWEIEGFAEPRYAMRLEDGLGLYRRTFRIPENWRDGRRVCLRFDGVLYAFDVWVNGKKVGAWDSPYNPSTFDITDALASDSFAENTLAVHVTTKPFAFAYDVNDDWSLSGIYRDVTLFSVPATHLQDLTTRTKLAGDGSAELFVSVMANQPDAQLCGKLLAPNGALVGEFDVPQKHDARFETIVRVSQPQLWTAETPSLYRLQLTLSARGRTLQTIEERIGLREISVVDGVLMLNGRPIKLRGADHHDLDPLVGRALTETEMRRDLDVMRRANMNFVRTSHYPSHPRFIELCDELGFYVMCEVSIGKGEENLDKPGSREKILRRAAATVARDQNRASVIIWSIGNENPVSEDENAAGRLVKQLDPSRPICIPKIGSYFEKNYEKIPDFVDIYSPHYPVNATLRRFGEILTRPIILTEYAHALGLATDRIQDQWEIMQANPRFAGGAIWHLFDQGILRRNDTPVDLAKPTQYVWLDAHRHYDTSGDEGCDGLVYSDRAPQTDFWETRKVYSPVQILEAAATVKSGAQDIAITVENRHDFRALAGMRLDWTLRRNRDEIQRGSAPLAAAARARETVRIAANIPANASADILMLELRCIDETARQLTERTVRLNLADATARPDAWLASLQPAAAKIAETADAVTITHPRWTLAVSRATGELTISAPSGRALVEGIYPHPAHKPTMTENALRKRTGFWRDSLLVKNDAPEIKVTREGDDTVRLTVSGRYPRPDDPAQSLTGSYQADIAPNGAIAIRYSYTPTAAKGSFSEAGLSLLLAPALTEFRWIGQGPFAGYPGKDRLNEFGIFHLNREDLRFQGNRRATELALVTAREGAGVALITSPADVSVERSGDKIILSHNAVIGSLGNKFTTPETVISVEKLPVISGSFKLLPLSDSWPAALTRLFGEPAAAPEVLRPYYHSYDQ